MNPHAPVTLASSEALERAATSSQRPLLGLGWGGVAVERSRAKGQGRGHRALRCQGPAGRGYRGLMEWLKVENCNNARLSYTAVKRGYTFSTNAEEK